MSIAAIRAALDTALAGMSPTLETAHENSPFTPPAEPYQRVFLRLSKPVGDEAGATYTEAGYLQVSLYYPPDAGSADIDARVDLLRQTFARGASFTAAGVVVTMSDPGEVLAGLVAEGRWSVSVRLPFSARIAP
jgi:hypothetical protein